MMAFSTEKFETRRKIFFGKQIFFKSDFHFPMFGASLTAHDLLHIIRIKTEI